MIWTLVITDGSYIEVFVFNCDKPTIEDIVAKIDFDDKKAVTKVLQILIDKHFAKCDEYQSVSFDDAGKKYLFHLQCHGDK